MTEHDALTETAHRQLSRHDWRFRQLARERPELLLRASFASLDAPSRILFYPLQSWPSFIDRPRLDELADAATGMIRLVRSIPERVFRNDPEALDAFYDIGDPTLTELLFDRPNGIDGSLARGDFIRSAQGLSCIELNVAANLGGWETGLLARMHLANPVVRKTVEELGISVHWIDTTEVLFAHLLEETGRLVPEPEGEVQVALVLPADRAGAVPEELAAHLNREFRRVAEEMGAPGGRISLCTYPQLAADGLVLSQEGRRVHAVVELYLSRTPPEIYRCFKAGSINLYNGPLAGPLSDKRNLALLSDDTLATGFSREERRLIDSLVPWTRMVSSEPTVLDGREVHLAEVILELREEMVLKRGQLGGGKGVHIGRVTSAAEWAALLETALTDGGWVVQRYVESLPYLFQSGEYGCCSHRVIWGPFVFGDRFGGAVLRMQPVSVEGAVNLSLTATQGILLGVGGDPNAPS